MTRIFWGKGASLGAHEL